MNGAFFGWWILNGIWRFAGNLIGVIWEEKYVWKFADGVENEFEIFNSLWNVSNKFNYLKYDSKNVSLFKLKLKFGKLIVNLF